MYFCACESVHQFAVHTVSETDICKGMMHHYTMKQGEMQFAVLYLTCVQVGVGCV